MTKRKSRFGIADDVEDAKGKLTNNSEDVSADKEKSTKEKEPKDKKKKVESARKVSVKNGETEKHSKAAANTTVNKILEEPIVLEKDNTIGGNDTDKQFVTVQSEKKTGKILAMVKGRYAKEIKENQAKSEVDNSIEKREIKLTKDLINLRLIAIHKGYKVKESGKDKYRFVPID